MRKEYLVYQNKVYSNFVNYINDYILLSEDPAMLKEGYFPYSSYIDGEGEGLYGKLVPYSEVSQRYSVYDRVLYKEHEFTIAGYKHGDDDFTAPDSYVRILVSDKEFLKKSSFCLDWNACLGNTPAIAFFSKDFVYLKIHILPFYSLLFI